VERVGEENARVATQIVPKAVFGFDPDLAPFDHDVARARELMTEAGLGDGFEVTLHRSGAFGAAAAAVAEQLAAIGIRGIREVAAIFSATRRKEALQALMRKVREDRVWIPLYYADNQYLFDRTVDYVPRDDGYLHLPRIRPVHR
jgi:hypothetical protein